MNTEIAALIAEANSFSYENNSYMSEYGNYTKATPQLISWVARCKDCVMKVSGQNGVAYEIISRVNMEYYNGYEKNEFDENQTLILGALMACKNLGDSSEKGPHRFQILSLDGGGIKGVFTAALLAAIEEDCKTSIIDHFDLIAGTSTGGIIAIGIGLGLKPREILDMYASEASCIFKQSIGTFVLEWIRRKYNENNIETVLKKRFGDKRFGDSKKRLVITSYNSGEGDIYLFRTAHHQRLARDYKVPAWKVARATSAAPTYFSNFKGIDNLNLIDGGVFANNPTMVALAESYGTLEIPLQETKILSIGTFIETENRISGLQKGGKIQWAKGSRIVDTIMRGQSISASNQAEFFVGKSNYLRINPTVAKGEFSLDGISNIDDMIGTAAHHSRSQMPTIRSMFLNHFAPAFNPEHN